MTDDYINEEGKERPLKDKALHGRGMHKTRVEKRRRLIIVSDSGWEGRKIGKEETEEEERCKKGEDGLFQQRCMLLKKGNND